MKPKVSMCYRSPLGAVRAFDPYGGETVRLEPGLEADEAWERFQAAGVPQYHDAMWIDGPAPSAPEGGNETMTKTSKTLGGLEFNVAVEKPKVERRRGGVWTPFSMQISIPGTDGDTADLDMYRVEYGGEALEVQRNRAGVKRANNWIRGLKRSADQRLKINRIILDLEEMIAESTDVGATARMKSAKCALGEPAEGC